MMLSEPGRTDYDFEFSILGFSVRVSVWFWVASILLGYDSAKFYGDITGSSPAIFLLIWIAVMFFSILLHELGHTLAFRRYGIHSSIVLYHFGGLAIPRGSFRGGGGRLTPGQQIVISAAGPVIQLALAAVIVAFLKFGGYVIPYLSWIPIFEGGQKFESMGVAVLVSNLLYVNIFWAVLNLVPIWPLDGGHIAREIVQLRGGTIYHSSVLSIACCAIAAALLVYFGHRSFLTLMFLASFAFTNYQIMNSSFGRRW